MGTKSIRIAISPLENERNTINNTKDVAIEVIDEKTNVAIISDMLHPDIGVLKKAIESNEQRTVSVMKPSIAEKEWEDVDLFILYQPNSLFGSVHTYIQRNKLNSFVILGINTDLNFINSSQKEFRVDAGYPVQEVTSITNSAFSHFDISEFVFDGYPPLLTNVGPIGFPTIANEIVLSMEIKGVAMNSPLMSVLTTDRTKTVVLFGENIWKWRMQSYRENQDFTNFDDFIGKLVLLLSDNRSRDRLRLDYESIYEGSSNASMTASYFDETFNFDADADLSLKVNGKSNGVSREMPMLLKGNYYEADLSGLAPDSYNFTVSVKNENRSKSGSFTILDFDVEEQFTSSDYRKLGVLASNTQGKLFFPVQTDSLIDFVTKNERFRPIQSSTENVVSLIDFRLLLGIIAAALALEWLIRKYNGLI